MLFGRMSPRPNHPEPTTGPIRRTIVLLLSLILLAVGGWLFVDLLTIGRWAGVRLGMMGAFFMFLSGALLWEDFLEPLVRRNRER